MAADPVVTTDVTAPVDRATIGKAVQDLTMALGNLSHADRIAWGVARAIGDTLEAERAFCHGQVAQAGRRQLGRVAGEAFHGLRSLQQAIDDAATVAARATDLLRERQQ